MQSSLGQVDKLVDLIVEAQEAHPSAPPVYRPKVAKWLRDNISNPKVFIGTNKDVSAVIILIIGSDYFSLKKSVQDLIFYSNSAGAGFRVLREAKKWIESWGDSVHSAYISTSSSNDDIDNMIERFGMNKVGSMFTFDMEKAA